MGEGLGSDGVTEKGPNASHLAALATRWMTVSSEGNQVAGEEDELKLLES